jgi:hypothetical protein
VDADFFMLDPGGGVFSHRHVTLAGIANGCFFPSPSDGR